MQLVQVLKNFIRDEEGVTAIEYGLIAALIAVAIIVAAGTVGTNLDAVFDFIATSLSNALTAAGG